MSIKIENVIKHYIKHGAVNIELDSACGTNNMRILNRGGIHVLICGASKRAVSLMDIRNTLEANRIYVISWGN